MADRRVAITGLGCVTPAGIGIETLWQNLLAGSSGVKTIDLFDASKFTCNAGGQLTDFSARNYVPKDYRKAVKVMARDIEIAVAAADIAFKDSGLVTRATGAANMTIPGKRLGCNIGAGLICSDLDELGAAVNTALDNGKFSLKLWGSTGMANLTPLWLLKYLPNMLSCHVTIIHGCEGPSNCITCGDASGPMAVGETSRYITRGAADAAIAGGAESKLNPVGLLRQELLKRLCDSHDGSPAGACRPFDAGHRGTVIGEGGSLLVLEELEHAKARGAKIYAEVVGFGGGCDPAAIDVLKPSSGGLETAVRNAVRDAGIKPEQVGMIMAHGTGVPAEDALECQAWRDALGESAEKTPAVAVTGATGSLFAGGGATSLAVAAMAMAKQTVPPTVNFTAAADGCGLNFSSQARAAKIEYAVAGAFTIGGQSGAVVLKRYEN